MGRTIARLRLPRGGVAQRWAGEPAGWSTSIGEALVGELADAVAAYEWGVAVGAMMANSWEAEGGSMSMGVEEDALVHLVVGGLVVVGVGLRKGKKLPSFLEGVAFQGAMVERKAQPEGIGVL